MHSDTQRLERKRSPSVDSHPTRSCDRFPRDPELNLTPAYCGELDLQRLVHHLIPPYFRNYRKISHDKRCKPICQLQLRNSGKKLWNP